MNPLHKLLILLVVGTLASCGRDTPAKPKPVGPVSSALQSGHWKRVTTKPPTYFPVGTPDDQPTDYRDGFWVESGDSQIRFFIPAHGTTLSQEHLIAEAQQAMTPEAQKELKRKGREIAADDLKGKTAEGISRVVLGMAEIIAHVASAGHR